MKMLMGKIFKIWHTQEHDIVRRLRDMIVHFVIKAPKLANL